VRQPHIYGQSQLVQTVIGATIIDIYADVPVPELTDVGRTYPGHVTVSCGGVGRCVCTCARTKTTVQQPRRRTRAARPSCALRKRRRHGCERPILPTQLRTFAGERQVYTHRNGVYRICRMYVQSTTMQQHPMWPSRTKAMYYSGYRMWIAWPTIYPSIGFHSEYGSCRPPKRTAHGSCPNF
jgi:hypothetical protein